MADCPDPIQNLKDAIAATEEAYVTAQIEGLKKIGENLGTAANDPSSGTPSEKLATLCASLGASLENSNQLRNSCSFDPSGCLKEVLDSGILDGNPVIAGIALAAATFVDAVTGNYNPPFIVPPPTASVGTTTPSFPVNIDIPEIPSAPPSEDCQDPIADLNAALASAEKTFYDLNKEATQKLSDTIKEFTGGLEGIPTSAQIDAFCVGASASFDAVAALNISCKIDVGTCIKEVLQSGIFGGNPALSGAALGAALFADSTAGSPFSVS